MNNTRLQNIAKLSVLYFGCLFVILIFSKIGLSDNWSIGVGVAYLIVIVVLEKMGIFAFFRGIAIAGTYAFISLICAHYAFNVTKDHSYLSAIGYVMILNFLISCGYLIYVLHTSKPRHSDAES
jgi:hypothetical protein